MTDTTKRLLALKRGKPVAPYVMNTITLSTVALGQLSVLRVRPERGEQPFRLELRPIYGAYLICLQRTFGGVALPFPLPPRFGRTNSLGWMVERDEEDIEGPMPQATVLPPQSMFGEPVGDPMPLPARDQLLLDPGETYELFWSFDLARFQQCCQALREDPSRFPEGLVTHKLTFQEIQPADVRKLALEDEQTADRVARYLLRSGPTTGCVRERDIGFDVGVFDVTAPALRALYLCEFLQWYTVRGLQKSGNHLAVLSRAQNLVEAAYHGRPDFNMDSQFTAAPGTPERQVLDHYRDFVWQCAANGVAAPLVKDSLEVTQGSLRSSDEPRWHAAATRVKQQSSGRAIHPVFRGIEPPERLVLGSSMQHLLADYFDMYFFGARLRKRGFGEQVGGTLEGLSKIVAANRELKAQLLHGHADHAAFMDALDRTLLAVEQRNRLELLERYTETSADACYAWWAALERYSADEWRAFQTRVKWINDVAGGFGKAFEAFFGRHLRAYTLAHDQANLALTTFFRYHATTLQHRGLQVFEERLPILRSKVRVDFRANTITVLEAFAGTSKLMEPVQLAFTSLTQRVDPAGLAPPPGNMTDARRQRFDLAKATGNVVEYDVELPVDARRARELGLELPGALGLACGAINTALGTLAAVDGLKGGVKLERQHIEVWFELGKNVVGLVDSMAAVQEAMLPKVDGAAPLLKRMSSAIGKASRSVAVLDSAYNLVTGLELLFSDDGAVAFELRQGRSVRAQALRAKGILQLASAATGGAVAAGSLALFGGGSAAGLLAAATGPVGLALAAGGVLVVCIDATLALTEEFGAQTAELETQLDAAEQAEMPADRGAKRRKPALTETLTFLQEMAQAARP